MLESIIVPMNEWNRLSADSVIVCILVVLILVKNPWVHGLNKSRVPSQKVGTIYRVAI